MISLHMVGDKVVFYSHKIECQTPSPPEELTGDTPYEKFHDRLGMHRVEPDGLYADNGSEPANIEAGLTELGCTYTVTDIRPTQEQIDKAKEIEGKTGSPRVVLDYILSGIVPEKMAKEREIDDLKARVGKLEKKGI